MAQDDIDKRRQLTFLQAEGAAPLPTQMGRKEITPRLAAMLWELLRHELDASTKYIAGTYKFVGNWYNIMYANHVVREARFGDDFPSPTVVMKETKQIFSRRNYLEVFDFLQFVIRHANCPDRFRVSIERVLRQELSPYRIIGGDTFIPITSDEEQDAVIRAFSDTSDNRFVGARSHLKNSARSLSQSKFADSVRESIHAVEAVARTLEPTAELSKALTKLEASTNLHPAMKKAFASLYGYASDEQGIRHPLLEAGDPAVDESDALFMLGACSSFVSYLISKAAFNTRD